MWARQGGQGRAVPCPGRVPGSLEPLSLSCGMRSQPSPPEPSLHPSTLAITASLSPASLAHPQPVPLLLPAPQCRKGSVELAAVRTRPVLSHTILQAKAVMQEVGLLVPQVGAPSHLVVQFPGPEGELYIAAVCGDVLGCHLGWEEPQLSLAGGA